MAGRKWLVRGVVFGVAGAALLAALLYYRWTNPEAVRRQVLARVEAAFVGVNARLESARLRLFGGIAVRELRLSRRDDLDRSDFLYVPSAIIYHDKETLLDGKLGVRKVEAHRPRLRVVRGHDGRWNLEGLLGPSDPAERGATLVIKQGTVTVEDRLAAPGTPPLLITNVSLTVVNDPLPVITFDGSGQCEATGPLRLRGRMRRGGPLTLTLEAGAVAVGPGLVRRLDAYCPGAAEHLHHLSGRGKIALALTWDAKAEPALSYAVTGELTQGAFRHKILPWPLEQVEGSFRCVNGLVTDLDLRAAAGKTRLHLAMKDLVPGRWSRETWDEAVRELDLTCEHVTVNKELFDYLPDYLREYEEEYSPAGTAGVTLTFRREAPGHWHKRWVVRSEGLSASYRPLPYPVHNIRGTLKLKTTRGMAGAERETASGTGRGGPECREKHVLTLDVRGEAGGRPVFLKGAATGPPRTCGVDVEVWGENLPVDETLLSALPERSESVARGFHPTGLVDFRVFVKREPGCEEMSNHFIVKFHDGTVEYKVFPLPLKDVSGTLEFFPDRWEFRDFVGRHNGGEVRAAGRSHPLHAGVPARRHAGTPGGPPDPGVLTRVSAPAGGPERAERVSLEIRGTNLPLDEAFRKALAPGREELAKAWDTFRLTGRMNFFARIDNLPDRPSDIDVTVAVGGCRMKPTFFPYPLEEVGATVRYANHSVRLTDFHGRHGKTRIHVREGTVVFPERGGFWAELKTLQADPLVIDADLERALPAGLRRAAQALQIKTPIALDTTLIVNHPPEPGADPTVYWKGSAKLREAALRAGVEMTGVTGEIYTVGLHDGRQLEGVSGKVVLEKATVLNQPLRNLRVPVVVRKGSPSTLRLPNMSAELFGGTIGGEGRIEFGDIFRYELLLKAAQVRLEELGKHNFENKAELSGLATAGIHLQGEGTDLMGLSGNGRLDVPSGKMYRLPLLLDLMKWLGLRVPDRTAFEQAHATFRIDGPRVGITRLDLYGSAISVRGQGTMNLDGTDLRLDLNADWGRLSQLLPAGVNDLTREISNQLLKIKVRGSVSDVRFEKELVPIVTDPLRRVWDGIMPGKGG